MENQCAYDFMVDMENTAYKYRTFENLPCEKSDQECIEDQLFAQTWLF